MYNFDFSYAEYLMFLEKCPFSDEEKQIIELKRKGNSNIQICFKMNISQATLSRRIKKIFKKIQKEL